jgi:hypothetical protein
MEVVMFHRMRVLPLVVLLFVSIGIAKEKTKTTVPNFVLNAKTVRVLIDPEAGTPMDTPMANKTAQEDVEKALRKWGRLSPVLIATDADLVIVIRKGTDKAVQPIVGGEPTNTRPVVVQPSDNGIHVGVSQGRPPDYSQTNSQAGAPTPGVQMGRPEDLFMVYDGHGEYSAAVAPVWKYVAKNGLKSPDVPAVAEFRKAIEDALKQQKKTP